MTAVIYRWRNIKTGHVYIGSTANKSRREREHRQLLITDGAVKRKRHPCRLLAAAWKEFGQEAFVFEVLEEILEPLDSAFLSVVLIEREQWHIDQIEPRLLYNIARPGSPPPRLGRTVSPEGRKRISEAHKGQVLAPENLAKLIAANTGRTVSSETREKIAAAQRGRKYGPERVAKAAAARKGWVPSEEWREKFRQIHTGRKRPPEVGLKISAVKMGHSVTAETRAKISAAKTGIKQSPDQRRRNSESKLGKPKPWLRGRKHTDNHRRLNSERLKALWADPEWRANRLAQLAVARDARAKASD